MIALENKTRPEPGFLEINCQVRDGIQKTFHLFIHKNFQSFAFDYLIAVVMQLIQSQPQAGTASTESREHQPERGLPEFRF